MLTCDEVVGVLVAGGHKARTRVAALGAVITHDEKLALWYLDQRGGGAGLGCTGAHASISLGSSAEIIFGEGCVVGASCRFYGYFAVGDLYGIAPFTYDALDQVDIGVGWWAQYDNIATDIVLPPNPRVEGELTHENIFAIVDIGLHALLLHLEGGNEERSYDKKYENKYDHDVENEVDNSILPFTCVFGEEGVFGGVGGFFHCR